MRLIIVTDWVLDGGNVTVSNGELALVYVHQFLAGSSVSKTR